MFTIFHRCMRQLVLPWNPLSYHVFQMQYKSLSNPLKNKIKSNQRQMECSPSSLFAFDQRCPLEKEMKCNRLVHKLRQCLLKNEIIIKFKVYVGWVLPSHVDSSGVIWSVSSGFVFVFKPVSAGIKIVGNVTAKPQLISRKFFAQLARTWANIRRIRFSLDFSGSISQQIFQGIRIYLLNQEGFI